MIPGLGQRLQKLKKRTDKETDTVQTYCRISSLFGGNIKS